MKKCTVPLPVLDARARLLAEEGPDPAGWPCRTARYTWVGCVVSGTPDICPVLQRRCLCRPLGSGRTWAGQKSESLEALAEVRALRGRF